MASLVDALYRPNVALNSQIELITTHCPVSTLYLITHDGLARAVNLTMNRDSIRDRATKLGIKTANYKYANNKEQLDLAIKEVGLPCIIKPVMSSSGKGQTLVQSEKDSNKAWSFATKNMRGDRIKVIIEEFINFETTSE